MAKEEKGFEDAPVPGVGDDDFEPTLLKLYGELQRVDSNNTKLNTAVKVLAGAVGGVVLTIIAVGILFAVFINANRDRIEDGRKSNVRETGRVTAALVGNCAVGNVIIGFQHDTLATMKTMKPFVTTPEFENWLDRRLEVLQPVECKAIVPEELGTANLCLMYPSRIDPDTGLPIPTTTTPENGNACREQAGGEK